MARNRPSRSRSRQTSFRPCVEILECRCCPSNLVRSFLGMNYTTEAAATPPDTQIAVGPNSVVSATNTQLLIQSKSGTSLAGPTQFSTLFQSVMADPSDIFTDPEIAYDDVTGRFYFGALEYPTSGNISYFDFAVSKTSAPTDFSSVSWTEITRISAVNEGGTLFSDYPQMGFNADAVFVSLNNADASGTTHDFLLTISQAALVSGTPLVQNTNYFTTTVQTDLGLGNGVNRQLIPSKMQGNTPGNVEYFVQQDQDLSYATQSTVNVVAMSNYLSVSPTFKTATFAVNPYDDTLNGVPQLVPANPQYIEDNFNVAYWDNNLLVAAQNIGPTSGTAAVEARWYEFSTSGATPALVQQGTINPGPGISTSYPSMAVDANGDIGMTFVESSNSLDPSVYVTGRAATDPLNTMQAPVLVQAGVSGAPIGARGGDFAAADYDPTTSTFWAANEYTYDNGSTDDWGIAIAQFTAAAIALSPASGNLPSATLNNPYTETLTASGGSGSGYLFSEAGLPGWLSVSASGGTLTLTGKPTSTAGSPFSFTVTVTDSAGDKITNTYNLAVLTTPITITGPATLPLGTAGNPYNQTTGAFGATGGTGPYTFSATGLPGGMSVNTTTDVLTGTPTVGGTYTVTVTATDRSGGNGSKTYSLKINPALTVGPAVLPPATVNNAYSQTLTPSGGSGSGYSVTVSGLPNGLSFSPGTDLISGIPTGPGSFTVTVGITDGIGATGSQTYTLTVDTAPAATPTTLPYAAQGGPYTASLAGTGGSGSGYRFSISGGSPPPGITFSNGQFGGAATVATGSYTFTVTITDGINAVGTQSFTINVEGPITISPASLPIGTVNDAYNQTTAFSASGGSGSGYTFTATGTVPGLTFSTATDTFTGTPTQAGTFTVVITATDSAGGKGTQSYTLKIDPALTVSPSPLPVAVVNSLYSVTLTAGGGSGSGYTLAASGLPGWLVLTGNRLSGTPTSTTGSPFSFTITVTDSIGATGSQTYSLTVEPPLTLGPGVLPSTAQGDPYYAPLTASGGSGTGYTFSSTGNLPAGLGFSGNVLTGVASSPPGVYTFTVTVTDSAGITLSQNYNLTITVPVGIGTTALPPGTLGSTYSATLTAQAGSGSGYVFTESGALPAGLNLSYGTGTLTISGTPSQYGTFPIQVSVTDGKGGTTSQTYTLVVNFSLGNSPNGTYVDNVYQQLLHRAPDPAAQGWVDLLNKVGPSAAPLVVAGVEASVEYLSDVVNSIYLHYLGRNADPAAAAWVNALAGGESFEAVTASIVASAEYYADHGNTNTGFVSALYKDVLGRAADSAGLNSLVGYLNAGGSRFQAALGLLTSTEYHQDLVGGGGIWNGSYPIYPWAGYYMQFLHRGADAGGLAGWTGALNSGVSDQQVLAAFLGSAEAYSKNS